MNVIFHIGMGKTGTTSLQAALPENEDILAARGMHYLGQWMERIDPQFDQFAGFQRFLALPRGEMISAAHRFLDRLGALQAETGAGTFLLSNEQYYPSLPVVRPFFETVCAQTESRIVIFVRAPAQWLPSAYTQWGLVHKADPGAIRPFGEMARSLMAQYAIVRDWHRAFGARVEVHKFDPHEDIVASFSRLLGVELRPVAARHQARPSAAETLLRAFYNNRCPDAVLPEVFDAAVTRHLPARAPESLSEKVKYIFDYSDLPDVLADYEAVIAYIEQEFGIDIHDPADSPPLPDAAAVADDVTGRMIDIIVGQAAQIEAMRTEIAEIRASLSPHRPFWTALRDRLVR